WAVQLGTTCLNPQPSGRLGQQTRVQVGNHNVVPGLPGFHENASVRVEDHGIARADLVVVHANTIAEDKKEAVVMRSAWEPAHKPTPPFIAAKFALDGFRVFEPIVPKPTLN